MSVKFHNTEKNISVVSPFHPELPAAAKKIGGAWDGKAWVFDARDIERVERLYKEIYGYDKNNDQIIDIRVKLKADSHLRAHTSAIYLAGREVARATGRDSGAKLGAGVVLVSGDFTSGGSAKNWLTLSSDGVVFEMRDVYRPAFENIENMLGWDSDIESVEIMGQNSIKRSNAEILEEIAGLEREIAALKAELV